MPEKSLATSFCFTECILNRSCVSKVIEGSSNNHPSCFSRGILYAWNDIPPLIAHTISIKWASETTACAEDQFSNQLPGATSNICLNWNGLTSMDDLSEKLDFTFVIKWDQVDVSKRCIDHICSY